MFSVLILAICCNIRTKSFPHFCSDAQNVVLVKWMPVHSNQTENRPLLLQLSHDPFASKKNTTIIISIITYPHINGIWFNHALAGADPCNSVYILQLLQWPRSVQPVSVYLATISHSLGYDIPPYIFPVNPKFITSGRFYIIFWREISVSGYFPESHF